MTYYLCTFQKTDPRQILFLLKPQNFLQILIYGDPGEGILAIISKITSSDFCPLPL